MKKLAFAAALLMLTGIASAADTSTDTSTMSTTGTGTKMDKTQCQTAVDACSDQACKDKLAQTNPECASIINPTKP